MEEHYNRIFEEFVAMKNILFDDPLLQDVVGPSVHHFNDLKNEWGLGVGLAKRKGHHPEPHSLPEVRTYGFVCSVVLVLTVV